MNKKWTRIHFYFDFRAGTGTPNTIQGMWRSLAFQLAENIPETRQYFDESATLQEADRLSSDVLKDRIVRAVEITDGPILALIDGLDEFAGNLAELGQLLINLKDHSGMKICVASRPESSFLTLFRSCPSLKMQDYNESSIRSHVEGAIEFRRYTSRSTFPESLRDKIIFDAKGVILWARLAVDNLLDGCDEGLNKEGLEKRLDDLPRELEELYQRILDKMTPAYQSETALIFYLVINSRSYTRLSDLYRVWLYVLQKTGTGFVSVNLNSLADFESRLLAMSGGLLDIGGDEEDGKIILLIHRTVQSYLEASKWAWDKLPRTFQQQFPDRPWLRLYAFAIEHAALELKTDRETIFNLLKKRETANIQSWVESISADQSWHGWPSLLPHIVYEIFPLAEYEENIGFSVSDIISEAMDTDLISLHLITETSQWRPRAICMPWHASYSDFEKVRKSNIGLMYGVSHSLAGYVKGTLQSEPTLSSEEVAMLLDLALLNLIRNPSSNRIEVTRLAFFYCRQNIQSRHLCLIFSYESLGIRWIFSGQIEELGILFCELLPNRQQNSWPWDHHHSCNLQNKQCGPLYHWAIWSASNSLYSANLNPFSLKSLLTFLLNSGEQINGPCSSTGHVLHAILDFPPLKRWDRSSYMLLKFLIAVKAGADPQIANQSTNLFVHARKLKRRLYFEMLIKLSSKRGIRNRLKETNTIIDILKDHEETGRWTLFDRYYDRLVEEAVQ